MFWSIYYNIEIPRTSCVQYLRLDLNARLNWREHIDKKRKQTDLRVKKLYWLLGKKSKLSLENNVLIYKTITIPIWTYGQNYEDAPAKQIFLKFTVFNYNCATSGQFSQIAYRIEYINRHLIVLVHSITVQTKITKKNFRNFLLLFLFLTLSFCFLQQIKLLFFLLLFFPLHLFLFNSQPRHIFESAFYS